MIVKEFYTTREDGVNLYITYSDLNLKIRKVGTDEIYDEAIDVEGATFTYEETDIPIEPIEESTETDYQNALEELGVIFDEENIIE
jgi:formylmethanofuran dehydrogenase subunit E-like metal-binding protein